MGALRPPARPAVRVIPGAVGPIDIDARGHRCPVPTLRLQRALERTAPGATVALLADDPLARVDVPLFARSKRYVLVSQEEVVASAGRSEAVLFLIQKPEAADETGLGSRSAASAVRSSNGS